MPSRERLSRHHPRKMKPVKALQTALMPTLSVLQSANICLFVYVFVHVKLHWSSVLRFALCLRVSLRKKLKATEDLIHPLPPGFRMTLISSFFSGGVNYTTILARLVWTTGLAMPSQRARVPAWHFIYSSARFSSDLVVRTISADVCTLHLDFGALLQ